MVLVGVFNGYYRSGTTIWMRIMDESNPNLAVLSEPTSCIVVNQIAKKGFDGIEPLHGWNIFRGYGKLSEKTFNEYKKRWKEVFSKYSTPRGIMTSWDDVVYLLEPFIECDEKVLIKSTQLHFYLHRIEKELKIPCLHIVRNLADNIAGHLSLELLKDKNKALEILASNNRDEMFWVDSIYKNITDMLGIDFNIKKVISKLVFNISVCNKFVKRKGVTITCFERELETMNSIIQKFGIHIHKHKLQLFDKSRVSIAPTWLRTLVFDLYHGHKLKLNESIDNKNTYDLFKTFGVELYYGLYDIIDDVVNQLVRIL